MEILKQIALYTRDLLSLPEAQIIYGRRNRQFTDYDVNRVVLDTLTASTPAKQYRYDPEAEQERLYVSYLQGVTANFFGVGATELMQRFVQLRLSYESERLQRTYGFARLKESTITDLRFLTGVDYHNRYEVAFNVRYTLVSVSDALRIDTPQFQFLLDK